TGAGEAVEDVGTAAEALENEREIGRRDTDAGVGDGHYRPGGRRSPAGATAAAACYALSETLVIGRTSPRLEVISVPNERTEPNECTLRDRSEVVKMAHRLVLHSGRLASQGRQRLCSTRRPANRAR